MEANPYSTPAANLYGTSTGGGDIVAASTIAQLAGTKPWVRFMAVIMWLSTILMIIAAVVMLAGSASGLGQAGSKNAYNAGMLTGMAIYYGVVAFVMMYPSVKLWKYASSIGRLKTSLSVADLDAALAEQRRYWKFFGIMMTIFICLALIGFVAAIAFGASMAKAASGM